MKFSDFKIQHLSWKLVKKLANLNFAIAILFLIAIFSILGSLIEQDQSLSYYKTYYPIVTSNIFLFNWRLIYYLGLDHLYQTWWFIGLLLILIMSLLACTFSTQLPSLKNARRWKFINSSLVNDSNYSIMHNSDMNSCTNMIYSLIYSNFFVFHQKNSIYGYKGLYGRVAPIFVHFSMIIILLGSVMGSLSGFVAQEMVPSGEVFHLKNIIHAGRYNILPLDFIGNVENFYITYNIDSSIKQFFSKISLSFIFKDINKSSIIFVNSPLKFRGLTLYQTDWQINALRIKLGTNFIIQKTLVQTNFNNKTCWLCKVLLSNNKQIYLILFDLSNRVYICDDSGILINNVSINSNFYLNSSLLNIKSIIASSGLQVKFDPGIFFVYLGFLIVMLSTMLSYVSYSQIWVYITINLGKFIGSTNRAILFFERDTYCINDLYSLYTFDFNYKVSNLNILVNKILV